MNYKEELENVLETPKVEVDETYDLEEDIGFSRQLRDIYSHPVLVKGEDQRLFRQIAEGDAAELTLLKMRQKGELSPGQQLKVRMLEEKIAKSEAAKVRLLEGVQQYVVKVARAFQGRGVPLEDLIQEGNLGVLKAIEKFEPNKGFAFLTYADDWIRQRMSRACTDKGSLEKYHMRMPCHMYMAIGRVQKHMPILHDELGREPTVKEIVSYLEKIGSPISINQAEQAMKVLGRSTVSLDAHWANEDSDVNVGEAIADDQAVDPLKEIAQEERNLQIWQAFNQLNEQEQEVLKMRIGLGDDGKKYTQEQVCKELNIKKSKLVAIQRKAISKLRASAELRGLAEELISAVE